MKKIIGLLLFIVCTGCVNAQLLYKITKPGVDGEDYIFGTHHIAPVSVFQESDTTLEAFNKSNTVVGELDMRNMMQIAMVLQSRMMAPSDSTLSRMLSESEYKQVSEVFKLYAPMPGVSLEFVDGMKPMVVSSMIALGVVKAEMPEFEDDGQLDSFIQQLGSQNNKKIIGLETAEEQAEILYDSQSIAEQAANLIEMVGSVEKLVRMSRELNRLYMAGDIEGLYKLSKEEGNETDFDEKLLRNRNEKWLGVLPDIIDENDAFIVVGALHLPGNDGLIEGLRSKGYVVTAVE